MKKYTKEQSRVCDYLRKITDDQIGCGVDPIGFLIASHEMLRMGRKADESLAQALQAATALFVSTGGHPKIDTSKPYVLLTEERRDEIVKALSRRAD